MRHFPYLLTLIILFGIKINAQTVIIDDIKYSISSQQASVIDLDAIKTIVEIPESITYDGTTFPVVSIGGFPSNGNSIESLTIPSSVTRLSGTKVLTSLKELYIKDSSNELWISNIYSYDGDSDSAEGRHAFYFSPLKELYLGRNLTYRADNSDGYSPFAGHNFENVSIGPSVTVLNRNLFWNCTFDSFSLEQAVSLRDIGDDALSKTNLEELILPESVESISNDFRFNQKLRYLYIGKNLSRFDYRFDHFYSLKNLSINIENINFASIDNAVYTTDKQTLLRWLPSVTISDTTPARKIGDHAFQSYQHPTLIIPQGAEILGSNLVDNCPDLSSIVIPASIKSINNGALSARYLNNTYESWYFDGDLEIYSAKKGCLIVLAEEPPTVGKDVFKGREDWTLWVPRSWYNNYLDSDGIYANGWDVFSRYVYGSQPINVAANILEAGKVSSDKSRYSAFEPMSLSLDYLDPLYNFIGWYDRDQLISSDYRVTHNVVSLEPIEARFEPIPDAASDIVSVYIIDGHLIVDINLSANAGVYETTLFDADGNELGSVQTHIIKKESRSVYEHESASDSIFLNAYNYSLIVYDNNSNKLAHYIGKVKNNNSVLTIDEVNKYSLPTVYYNLRGQKMKTPRKGEIYIVNVNGKYRKIYY